MQRTTLIRCKPLMLAALLMMFVGGSSSFKLLFADLSNIRFPDDGAFSWELEQIPK